MKRSNTAFIISLVIHVIVALIFAHVRRSERVRKGVRSIAVALNVEAPEPQLKRENIELQQRDINPQQRTASRRQARSVRIDRNMVKTDAYRDIDVTDNTSRTFSVAAPDDDLYGEGSYDFDPRARGASRGVKGGKTQLVEFLDKTRGARRIIYCMDVSASMGAANRLNLARGYMKDSLLALDGEKDMFNIIVFSNSTRTLYSDELRPPTQENLTEAIRFLDEYTPQNIRMNKKTNLLAVLLRALDMKPNIVVLVTDGLPTAGVTNPEKIIQTVRENNADNSVKIFAIGMEMDVEMPEAWLLKAIAEQNKGEYQFL